MVERNPVEASILDMDATTLAARIASRELSSLEVTNCYIEHLQRIQPGINCLVEDRFEKSRHEARLADQELAGGSPSGRLFGVPISIKESFNVAGMRTTSGIPHRRNLVEDQDAEIVNRLKREGAIILGKTNTPVLCFCQETDNKLYGRSNNPWDLSRTAGGSSGGEGALIAAGGAAVGIGSDIGGSIRFPSHFNGVIGFRSGNRQVSQEGSFPHISHPLQERMLGIGALAKSVQDARLINEIIACSPPGHRPLNSFLINIPLNHLRFPVDQSTAKTLLAIRQFLQEGFPLSDEQPPYYLESATMWQNIMSIDGAREMAEIAFGESPRRPLQEYLKEVFSQSSDLHRYFTWALLGARLVKPSQRTLREIERTIAEGDPKVTEYLDHRLLILPVYHTPAPRHGTVFRELFSLTMSYKRYIPFVAYVNTWGLPAVVVPVSENEDGLPIAVQITSRVGNEDALFTLAAILEKQFRGYRRCPL